MSALRELILLAAITFFVAAVIAFSPGDSAHYRNCIAAYEHRANARALFDQGRLKAALNEANAAESACPTDPSEVWDIQVAADAELGICDQARASASTIESAKKASPSALEAARRVSALCDDSKADVAKSTDLMDRGQRALAAGDAKSAATMYLQAWQSDHTSYVSLAMAGIATSRIGDVAGARRLFERAIGAGDARLNVDPSIKLELIQNWGLLHLLGGAPKAHDVPSEPVVLNDKVVVCMRDGVLIMDLHTNAMRAVRRKPSRTCLLSPDGARAFFGAEMIELAQGTTTWTADAGWRPIGFSEDGQLFGVATHGGVRVVDNASGHALASFDVDEVADARMSGRTLQWSNTSTDASVSYRVDVDPPKLTRILGRGPMRPVSADGHYRAYVESMTATVFIEDVVTHKQVPLHSTTARGNGHVNGGRISSMEFSEDGKHLVTHSARSTREFDVVTGQMVSNAPLELEDSSTDHSRTPDGAFTVSVEPSHLMVHATGSDDEHPVFYGVVPIANVAEGSEQIMVQLLDGVVYRLSAASALPVIVAHGKRPGGVAVAADESAYAWIDDGHLHVVDVRSTHELTMNVDDHEHKKTNGILITPTTITAVVGSTLYEWTRLGAFVRELKLGSTPLAIRTLSISPQGDFIIGEGGGDFSLWNLQTGVATISVRAGEPLWTHDGKRVLVLVEDNAIVLDSMTGAKLSEHWIGAARMFELRDDKAWPVPKPTPTSYEFGRRTVAITEKRQNAHDLAVFMHESKMLTLQFFTSDRVFIQSDTATEVVGDVPLQCTVRGDIILPTEACRDRGLGVNLVQTFLH